MANNGIKRDGVPPPLIPGVMQKNEKRQCTITFRIKKGNEWAYLRNGN